MKVRVRSLLLVILSIGSAFMVLPFSQVFAITPVTVDTTTGATAIQFPGNQLLCYSNGYYFAFFGVASTSAKYRSSQTGASWSALSASFGTPNANSGLAVYCDASGNVYAAWAQGASTWAYRQGTSSAGVITWSFAEVDLTCTSVPNFQCGVYGISVYAFDTTHVWVAVEDNAGSNPRFEEGWACTTSACSTAGHWADKKQVSGGWTGFVLGLSSSSNVALIYGNTVGGAGTFSVTTTNDGGTTWTAPVTTTNSFGTGTAAPMDGNCVSVSSSVYCAQFKSDGKTMYFLKFTQGGGSWTETGLVTFGSVTNYFTTISTDGTNLLTFYDAPTTTTIDYQTSTNLGSSWSGDAAWVTGEASTIEYTTSTPTLQSTSAGVMWALTTSSNIRFAASASLTVTVNLTCIQEPNAASATDTLSLSGASVSPTTAACSTGSGTTTALTASLSSTITATVGSASSGLAFRLALNLTSITFSTPGSGSQSNTIHDYLEDKTTASYSGTVAAAPIIHFTNSGNATTFTLGTGVHVLYHDQAATWTIAKPTANFPSATERYETNFANGSASANQVINPVFYHQWKPTIQFTPGVPNAWDGLGTYSEAVTGTQFGTAATTICTASLPHGTGTQSCAGFEDTGTTESTPASFASTVSGTWSAVGTHSWSITSAATQTATYNLGVSFTLSYAVSGGGSPTAPTVLCLKAGVPTNTSLTTTPTGYTCDVGTTWTVGHNPLGSGSLSSTERWFTAQALTGTVSSTSIVFTFYHQYGETASYSQTCAGGATCTQAPVLTFTYLGVSGTLYTETLGPVLKWIDAGSTATITVSITDTLGNVYKTTPTSWSINAANVIGNPSAYVLATVYSVCFHFILIGGGQYNAPVLSYIAPGAIASTLTLTTSQVCVSAIAGAWSVTNPLTGNSATTTQRAISGNTTSGTISGVLTETVVYWNQLFDEVGYTTTVPGATNNPTGMFVQQGQVTTFSLMQTPVNYWLDYNSHFSAQSPFTTMGMTIATLVAVPKQGLITNLDPIINYAPSASCSGNPLTQMLNLCVVPAIVNAWGAPTGVPVFMSFLILGVNVAVYNKSQSIAMALIVLLVGGAVFGFFLPTQVGIIANIFLYLGLAGLAVKLILAARGSG